jgi:superfamily II DNA/RNA helicase
VTPTGFEALGVSADLAAALHADGITEPFPIQALTIRDALAGRDICGKAKTGSGKTLAFGVPLLERVGKARPKYPKALVLLPTRELANQVSSVLEPLAGVRDRSVVAVYGGVSMDRQIRALQRGVDIVIGTPGRLIDLMERGEMFLGDVEVLVLDEADRMVDMGFLPQVQKLLYKIESEHQTMLFSATLDGAIDRIVRRYLHDPVAHEVVSEELTVEQMAHAFLLVHEMDKTKVVASIVRNHGRTLIFTRTKRGADRLVRNLEREKIRCAAIHGDLRQGTREKALADFTKGKVQALVATDVAARGLDIESVDVVVHYDLPEDHKAYLHRSGRTARAGATGVAVSLSMWNEENSVRVLQKRLGLAQPIIEIFSNDARLADLPSLASESTEPLVESA